MSFIFGAPGLPKTPQELARLRAVANALAVRNTSAPKNIGEGLTAIGNALAYRSMMERIGGAETAGAASATDAMKSIFSGAVPSPAPQSGQVPNAGASPMGNLPSLDKRVYSTDEFNPIDAQAATPEELAAGVPAPKQYAALIGKAAVDYDLPPELLAAQIKQESGFNPNAVSSAGAQGISQFMPGTAREMGVNPLDPESAIPGGARYLRQNIDKFGGSVPLGLAAYNAGPGRVERSGGDISRLPAETQGYVKNITGSAPVQTAQASPTVQQLMQAAQNPWLSSGQQAIVKSLLEREMQKQDPTRQLDLDLKREQLKKLQNPDSRYGFQTLPDGTMVRTDPKTGAVEPAYQGAAKPPQIVELFDEKTGQPYKAKYNAKSGEYERVGGIKAPTGTQLTVGPNGEVSFTQGAGIKPLTETQSKDVGFATRAAGSLPLIDQHGTALTNLSENVGGSVPVVGNYIKSEQYQKAEQAGREFLQAILRKDTGAAITKEETAEYGNVYLPQPGDGKEVLDQKRQSRHRALQALKLGLPSQAILSLEKAGVDLSGATVEPPQAAPTAPALPPGWSVKAR